MNRLNLRKIKITKVGKKNKAAATLTLVIVMQWMLLVLGLSLIVVNVNLTKASTGYNRYLNAKVISRTCLEESLRLIARNINFTGEYVYTSASGPTCTATTAVDGTNPNLRNISIVSSNANYYYEEMRVLDISTNPYMLVD
jgi:hypothetical protein